MKKLIYLFGIIIALSIVIAACEKNYNNVEPRNIQSELKANGGCVSIQNGTLVYGPAHYLAGEPLTTGYDIFGYNYQAHMFSGSYANVYLGRENFPPYDGDDEAYLAAYPSAATKWYWPYRNDYVMMKWNDAWMSNNDCDEDGLLDRHYGFAQYQGSGAWETNHQSGTYLDEYGNTCYWNYFCKIIAVPEDAVKTGGIWYNADGTEIGPDIWGEFAIIQEVYNDPCAGANGIYYLSPDHAGFGGW